MRMTFILSGITLLATMICCGASDEAVVQKRNGKAAPQSATKASEKASPIAAEKTPATKPVTDKWSSDEDAIRQGDVAFAQAYEEGNARSAAAHFTPDAEHVDEFGNVSHGRDAIEKSLTEFFAKNPGCKLQLKADSIRFIGPGVAVEDGTSIMNRRGNPASIENRYTTMHVKIDGKWLAASVRDHSPRNRREHREQLQELDWLIGDWVDEGDDSIVMFSCEPVDSGNFLLRKFSIQIAGQEVMSGTQRIGWDPLSGNLKAWIFDSDGGYAEGTWHRDANNWILKSTGVTADGETASGTSIYTFVNPHTMTWQSVDHVIDGVHQPDGEVVTIVRQAPTPATVIGVAPK